jgi:hypothetical protein
VTGYTISPPGVQHVVSDVGHVVEHDLGGDLDDVRRALDDAVEHIGDQSSPVLGAVQWLTAGVAGEIRGVASATALVVGAAVRAVNAYVEADDLMAREAGAREAAARGVGTLDGLSRQDALGRAERVGLDQWLANQAAMRAAMRP